MRSCNCPNCGAQLGFDDDGREYIFCQYCGTKIDLMDQRTVHTEHIVDDAKIKNAESIHRIVDVFASPFEEHKRKRQEKEAQEAREAAEAAEKARIQEEKNRENAEAFKAACGAGAALCFGFVKTHTKETLIGIAVICILISQIAASNSRRAKQAAIESEIIASSHLAMGEIQYPKDASSVGDYRNTYKKLKDAGFTNITLLPAGDLIFGIFDEENDIIEITVDGAPSFDEDGWYPADVPIAISYHSFIGSVSSAAQATKDVAAEKVQETVERVESTVQNVISSQVEQATSTEQDVLSSENDFPVISKAVLKDYSYEYAFFHNGQDDSHHYWLLDTNNYVACLINTYEQRAYLFSLATTDLSKGVCIDFGGPSYTLQGNNLSASLFVKYNDDGPYYFTATSTENALNELRTVQIVYDLRDVQKISFLPSSGTRSNKKASSTSQDKAISNSMSVVKTEPSVDYTPSHKETNYDAAYALRYSSYTNYCLISYQDKIVRTFSYGNDSKESWVGHITGGSKSSGLIVHYNYDDGWDETIRISGTQMIMTDANGNTYTFNVSPLSPVRDIYTDNNYHDISEK